MEGIISSLTFFYNLKIECFHDLEEKWIIYSLVENSESKENKR